MLWKPKTTAGLAALTGVLTILTCITFARMPDRFVLQIGWFVVTVGTVGGVALAAAGWWWQTGRERRTASVVLGILAIGDIACNLAAMRLGSPGVAPIPWVLHGATTIAAMALAIAAAAGWLTATERSAGRPTTLWGATIALTAVAIAGFAAFSSLGTRAIVPNTDARRFCGSVDVADAPFGGCLAREEAKPLSTNAFLVGLAGLGAAVFGTGLLCGSLARSRRSSNLAAVAAVLVGIGALNVAARGGVQDLDRLQLTRAFPPESCVYATPNPASPDARVLTPPEQAVRDCVVAAHGTNPWGPRFWADLAIGLLALFAGGWLLSFAVGRRGSASLDSA